MWGSGAHRKSVLIALLRIWPDTQNPQKSCAQKKGISDTKVFAPMDTPLEAVFRPRAGPGPDQQTGPPLERKSRANRPDHVGERAGPGGKIIHTSRLWRRKAWTPCCSGERRRPTENALSAETVSLKCRMGKTAPRPAAETMRGAQGWEKGFCCPLPGRENRGDDPIPFLPGCRRGGPGGRTRFRPRRRRTQSLWPTGIRRGGRAWGSPRSGRGTRCPSTQARRVNGGGIVDHCGVAAQHKCPAEYSA